MRYRQPNGKEISGFIDYEDRLRKSILDDEEGSTDWIQIFKGTKKLRPKTSDLGYELTNYYLFCENTSFNMNCRYYNWQTGLSFMNDSNNFKAITDPVRGLIFECRHDRQQLFIDPSGEAGSGSTRTVVKSNHDNHVVLFDHVIRSKI